MGNNTRNDYELPCYMDTGRKLFPEAIAGQRFDLSDPNTRDQMLKKHAIRETQNIGMKPVQMWLYVHSDALNGNTGSDGATANATGAEPTEVTDFYGDGGLAPVASTFPSNNDPGGNFYNEQPVKTFSGPFTINAEYIPNGGEMILSEMGVDRPVNDIYSFLNDDALRILGRLPTAGDLVMRFDGLIMEITAAVPFHAENFEWLYTQCAATNTNKDYHQFFGKV